MTPAWILDLLAALMLVVALVTALAFSLIVRSSRAPESKS